MVPKNGLKCGRWPQKKGRRRLSNVFVHPMSGRWERWLFSPSHTQDFPQGKHTMTVFPFSGHRKTTSGHPGWNLKVITSLISKTTKAREFVPLYGAGTWHQSGFLFTETGLQLSAHFQWSTVILVQVKKNKNAKNCLGSTVGQWHLGHFPHSPAGTAPAPSGSSSATSLLSKGKGKSCVSSVRRMQKLTSESRGRPLLHFKEDHSHICRSNQIFKYTLLIVRDELTQTAEQRIYLANFTLAWDLSH